MKRPSVRLTLLAATLLAAIFAGDLVLPLGVAGGVPYVAVVLLGWWFPKPVHIIILAAISTVLILAGYVYSPEGVSTWIVVINRVLAMFAVWVPALLLVMVKKTESSIQKINEDLEQRVEDRTKELLKSETLFRAMVDHSPAKIHIKDLGGRYTLINKVAEKLAGFAEEEGLGKTSHEMFGKDAANGYVAHDQNVLKSGQALEEEEVFTLEDGDHTFATTKFPIFDGGDIVAIGAIGTDVTSRRLAEASLQQSELYHRLAMDQANVAFWRWSFDEEKVVSWSDNYQEIGVFQADVPESYEEMLEFVHKDDRDRVMQTYLDADVDACGYDMEYRIVGPAGQIRHLHEHADVEYDAQGNAAFHVGIIQDITDRKQIEETLRISEKRLEAAQRNAHLGNWQHDVVADTLWWSDEVYRIFGVGPETFKTSSEAFHSFVHPDDRELVVSAVTNSQETNTPYSVDHRIVIPSGEVRWVHEQGETTYGESGEPILMDGIVLDITEQKKVEQEAVKANLAKSDFLAAMSHDLRTPLNAILGFSEFIQLQYLGPIDNEKYQGYIEDIHTSGRLLLSLVDDILDLSTIEAGKRQLDKENLPVVNVFAECKTVLGGRAESLNVGLIAKVPTDIEPLYADKRAITQSFHNLIANSLKFTPPGGSITFVASTTNGFHKIEIIDTGTGIPADRIATLTEPFVKVETDPHKSREGTGLGLAIVKMLVDLHGGELEIISQIGEGTSVIVLLPSKVL
ncbi:MAG: PAS domain-containing protein [Rhodospirillales bacterium]|nr:PAS domain-containing protein [Rhodospirillales bacterium]MBT5351077.1 PAS domain-containing protein [Rhodospirillales bacterium]MBT5520723.1 PAS domain-containing protein [Rhodospirillales bacterium]MBT6826937.1 PAS domain-containing protein [Rhodospirillales bacterium]MBT7148100.1 PAS domain-containing protein [Rhodospirillales bacterium]